MYRNPGHDPTSGAEDCIEVRTNDWVMFYNARIAVHIIITPEWVTGARRLGFMGPVHASYLPVRVVV